MSKIARPIAEQLARLYGASRAVPVYMKAEGRGSRGIYYTLREPCEDCPPSSECRSDPKHAGKQLSRWREHAMRIGGTREDLATLTAHDVPDDLALLFEHVQGKRNGRDFYRGSYLADETDCVLFMAIDLDNHEGSSRFKPLERLRSLSAVLEKHGLTAAAIANTSQSGNGNHLRLHFERPTPAWLARALGRRLLELAIGTRPADGTPELAAWLERFGENPAGGVEVFPKQDTAGRYGNLLGLPCSLSREGKGGTVLLDAALEAIPSKRWAAALAAVRPLNDEQLAQACESLGVDPKNPPAERLASKVRPPVDPERNLAGLSQGERNDRLYEHACSLQARGGVQRVEAKAILMQAAERCTPPMQEEEIDRIIESAWKFDDPEGLERARKRAASLPELAKTNPGALHEDEVISDLGRLYRCDRPTWVNTRASLRGIPGVQLSELDKRVQRAWGAEGEEERDVSVADQLIGLVMRSGVELFHDPDRVAYALVTINGHRETFRLGDRGFRVWLSGLYYQDTGRAASTHAMADAVAALEASAVHKGSERSVYVRIARVDGAIYLDLGNDAWEAVEITRTGWRVVSAPPAIFRRPKGARALPTPDPAGHIDELRELLNVPDDEDWILVKGWLVSAWRGVRPFAILSVTGEQGSAKSTFLLYLRLILDPVVAAARGLPRNEEDLAVAASNALLYSPDNLSPPVPGWISDALCRLATGGGLGRRELYEKDSETLFDTAAPILMAGISDLLHRPDLADRAIAIDLPRIPEEQRKLERTLKSRFEKIRPRILGGLLNALSCALRREDEVQLERLPRMADVAAWVTAAEPALGIPDGRFVAALRGVQEEIVEQALDADPLSEALSQIVTSERPTWKGTPSELLKALSDFAPVEQRIDRRAWPGDAKAMTGRLRRIAPGLRSAKGITIDGLGRRGPKGARTIVVTRSGDAVAASPDVQRHPQRHPVSALPDSALAQAEGLGDAGAAGLHKLTGRRGRRSR